MAGPLLGIKINNNGTQGKLSHLGKGEDSQGPPGETPSPRIPDKPSHKADAESDLVPTVD